MVTRYDVLDHVKQKYDIEADRLWMQYPGYEVFRHKSHKKWFGAIMDIPKNKIGLDSDEYIDILNIKCDPSQVLFLSEQKGFAKAYHMNKKHWLTIMLDGTVNDEMIYELLDSSYELTK